MPKLSFPLSASPLGITSGIFTRMPGILVSYARDIALSNRERGGGERVRGWERYVRAVNYDRANV